MEPFSLADRAVTRRILTTAGFTEIRFTAMDEPVYYGENCDIAFAVRRLRHISDLLATRDAATTDNALDRLHASLTAHDTDHGVLFDSHAWIVTARSLDMSPHR